MLGRTFCPLGDAAAMPAMALVRKFRDEILDRIRQAEAMAPVPGTQPLAVL